MAVQKVRERRLLHRRLDHSRVERRAHILGVRVARSMLYLLLITAIGADHCPLLERLQIIMASRDYRNMLKERKAVAIEGEDRSPWPGLNQRLHLLLNLLHLITIETIDQEVVRVVGPDHGARIMIIDRKIHRSPHGPRPTIHLIIGKSHSSRSWQRIAPLVAVVVIVIIAAAVVLDNQSQETRMMASKNLLPRIIELQLQDAIVADVDDPRRYEAMAPLLSKYRLLPRKRHLDIHLFVDNRRRVPENVILIPHLLLVHLLRITRLPTVDALQDAISLHLLHYRKSNSRQQRHPPRKKMIQNHHPPQ